MGQKEEDVYVCCECGGGDVWWRREIEGLFLSFFLQADNGMLDFCMSRVLGDVYKRQIERSIEF